MSSSVASGKVMERWAREREEAKNPRVQTKKDTQDNFNAMKPNFSPMRKPRKTRGRSRLCWK